MIKIIIGAGSTAYDGWIATQESELDLMDINSFARMFGKEETIDAFLAEHVFEHLTIEEGFAAAQALFAYLKPGGYARLAVPDVNFRSEWYHDLCKPGGPGPKDHPAFTHKVFYDYRTFSAIFEKAGFRVRPLEYCDENGKFHFNDWSPEQGMIGRSLRFDTRNTDGKLEMVSIIIDAVKPAD